MVIRFSLFVLPAALLAAPASTQTFSSAATLDVAGGAYFGRAVAAELDGDGHLDYVWQQNTGVRVAHGLYIYEAYSTVATGVTDFDVIEGVGIAGRDGLGLLLSTGLTVRTWGSQGATDDVWESNLWNDALVVRSGELEPGSQGFVGIDADSETILVTLGSAGHPTSSFPVDDTPPMTAIDVAPLQWDGSGDAEIAVLTTDGVYVHELDGTLVEFFRSASPGDVIVPMKAQSGAQPLAWLTTSAGPSNQLLLSISEGQGYSTPITVGSQGTWTAGHASDIDGDLVVYGGDGSEVQYFPDDGGSFDPADWETLTVSPPFGVPQSNTTRALLADFSGADRGEVVVGVQTTGEIQILEQDSPSPTGTTWNDTPPVSGVDMELNDPDADRLLIELSNLVVPTGQGWPSPQLQAVVWRRDGPTSDVESPADDNWYWSLSPAPSTIEIPLRTDDDFDDVCLAPTEDMTVYVELRAVELDGQGHVTNSTRAHVYAFHWSATAWDELHDEWIPDPVHPDYFNFSGTGSCGYSLDAGSAVAPGAVIIRRLPPLSGSPSIPSAQPGPAPL